MTDDEKKEIIEVLQSRTSWHYMDVQKMAIFGILAFLAQFVFNQFAGDGKKMNEILIAQEAMKVEMRGLSKEVIGIRENTEKDAERDVGRLQKQIDILVVDLRDRSILFYEAQARISNLEKRVERYGN
jgi:hypothetical protein